MGLRKIGAGCPTGPAMSPGRWFGLGGTCAPPFAPHLQHLLPVHGQPHGGRRPGAGCIPSRVPDAGELPLGARRLCDVGDSVTRNLLIDHYRRTKRDRVTDSLDDAMPVVENKESA